MTPYRTIVSSLLLTASLGFAAAPATAMSRDCGPGNPSGYFMEQRADRMEQHHKKLHAALKLTPEQEGAWTKLIAVEQPMNKGGPGMSDDWAKLTTPERGDKMLETMKARQAQMIEHVAAMKEFYAVLTPEQKKTFDDFHAASQDRMGRKSGRRASGMGKPIATP